MGDQSEQGTVVWAVSAGSYSDYRVLCVCPTKADAEAVATKLRGDRDGWHDDADVEEFQMVTAAVEKEAVLMLSTTLWDDGSESHTTQRVEHEWPMASIHDVVPLSWRWVRAPMHKEEGGRLDVEGTDHALVRKVYSERRARLIADDVFRLGHEHKGRIPRSGSRDGDTPKETTDD